MFPYPSAEGLHVGNLFAFTGADVYGRFQRLRGWNVFEPIGFDAFGIHSENFALKMGIHPAELIPRNIANFTRQLTTMGGMFAWEHVLSTTDPGYYRWTQWIFVQLFKRGLAYRKKGMVNWCPFDKTVLANEQVIAGKCERCGHTVEQRVLEQWYFRITEYAQRLLEHLDDPALMDWSETTAAAQRNWIGKSDGAEITLRGHGNVGGRHPGLHHPSRHAVRRHVPGAGPGASAGGSAHDRRPAGRGRRLSCHRGGQGPRVAQGGREGQDRRTTRHPRNQPGHRSRDSDLDRRLRADGLRHRRDHGGAGTRRARFRLRRALPAADRAGSGRPGRCRRRPARGATHRRRSRAAGALRRFQRLGAARGEQGDRALARVERTRHRAGAVPALRLVHLAPALLGPADPDHLLRRLRSGGGTGRPVAGAAPAAFRLPSRRLRRLAAGARPGVVLRPVPVMRQARGGARPTSPTRSSIRHGTSCGTPAPTSTTARSTSTAPAAGCR